MAQIIDYVIIINRPRHSPLTLEITSVTTGNLKRLDAINAIDVGDVLSQNSTVYVRVSLGIRCRDCQWELTDDRKIHCITAQNSGDIFDVVFVERSVVVVVLRSCFPHSQQWCTMSKRSCVTNSALIPKNQA